MPMNENFRRLGFVNPFWMYEPQPQRPQQAVSPLGYEQPTTPAQPGNLLAAGANPLRVTPTPQPPQQSSGLMGALRSGAMRSSQPQPQSEYRWWGQQGGPTLDDILDLSAFGVHSPLDPRGANYRDPATAQPTPSAAVAGVTDTQTAPAPGTPWPQQSFPSATVSGSSPMSTPPQYVPLPESSMRPIGGVGSPQAQDVSTPMNVPPVDVQQFMPSGGQNSVEQMLRDRASDNRWVSMSNGTVPFRNRSDQALRDLAALTSTREQSAAELQRSAGQNEAQIRAAQIQANAQGGVRPADIASLVVDLMPQVESQHPDWSQEAKIAEARRLAQSIVGGGTNGSTATGVNPMAVGQPRDYRTILREISGNPVEALAELRRRYSLSEEDAQPAIEALRGQFSREAMLPFEQGNMGERYPWSATFGPMFGGEQTDEQAALEWIRRNAMGRGVRNLGMRIPE